MRTSKMQKKKFQIKMIAPSLNQEKKQQVFDTQNW